VLDDGWSFAFEELAQRRGDFALSMAACALRVENGRVAEARVGVGSVVDRPTLLETDLVGSVPAPGFLQAAVEPFGSMHASAAYLRHLTVVLVERAVLRAWRNA
jgi:aerobic carbon-monoxide dehydrogenase medium subunit